MPPISDDVPKQTLKSSNALADDRTRLAVSRTMIALDRTLMAWVRTATSLISFGFTIYKFFQNAPPTPSAEAARVLIGPRGFAIVMMSLGLAGLALATYDHHVDMKGLQKEYKEYGPFRRSRAGTLGMLVAGLGVIGLVLALLRR